MAGLQQPESPLIPYLKWVIKSADALPDLGIEEDVKLSLNWRYTELELQREAEDPGWDFLGDRLLEEEDFREHDNGGFLWTLIEGAPCRLEDLLKYAPTHRWLVLGESGAGKTTLLRHAAIVQAKRALVRLKEGANPDPGAIPVLAALSAAVREDGLRPEEFVIQEFGGRHPGYSAAAGQALGEAIKAGQVVFLLDGLDEVPLNDLYRCRRSLQSPPPEWEGCGIVVASRRGGSRRLSDEYCGLELLPLGPEAQRKLLTNLRYLAEERIEEILGRLSSDSCLAELARRPFTLTVLGLLARDRNDTVLPTWRVEVYDELISKLIAGTEWWLYTSMEPGRRERKVKLEAQVLREAMQQLSLLLIGQPGLEWTADRISALAHEVPLLATALDDTGDPCAALAADTSLLVPTNWRRTSWRFLHHSLLSFLAAEALARRTVEDVKTLVMRGAGRENDKPGSWEPWVEPLAFWVDMIDDFSSARAAIEAIDPGLYWRVLVKVENVDLEEVLRAYAAGGGTAELDLIPMITREAGDRRRLVAVLHRLLEEAADKNVLYCAAALLAAVDDTEGRQQLLDVLKARIGGDLLMAYEFGISKWIHISPGWLQIGSTDGTLQMDRRLTHSVQIAHEFRILSTPVTQALYWAVTGRNPSACQGDLRRPVEQVSWEEARGFCSELARLRGEEARLPTEAEWEYACRAGTTTSFSSGDGEDDLDRVGWYRRNSGGKPHPVAMKSPNGWGLFDMHGNVWEWCADWAGNYRDDVSTDPRVNEEGRQKWIRGGSWANEADACRSSSQRRIAADSRDAGVGFRVVLP